MRHYTDEIMIAILAILAAAVVVILVVSQSGCASRSVVLYPDPIPEMTPPETPANVPEPDEAEYADALVPGRDAPFVTLTPDGRCAATRRAIVEPQSSWVDLYADSTILLPWWRDRALISQRYRQMDRDHAQRAVDVLAADRDEYRREADRLRVALPFAVVCSVVAGILIGVAADDVAGVVP